jgi:hypothetical protein
MDPTEAPGVTTNEPTKPFYPVGNGRTWLCGFVKNSWVSGKLNKRNHFVSNRAQARVWKRRATAIRENIQVASAHKELLRRYEVRIKSLDLGPQKYTV